MNNIIMDTNFKIPDLESLYVFQTLSETYDWGALDLNIPNIHKQTMGEDVKICIIDSGKSEHFETMPATIDSVNFTNSNTVNDKNGHSTAIAGIIAAQQNNDGIIGIAPKSKLYFAKAIDDGGRGDPEAIIKAIYWCIEKQIDIMSISAGMFIDIPEVHKAIKQAYERNIVTIAAAGNSGTRYEDIAFPARYPEVISVAAYGQDRKAANFSSRGINVKFAMPGVDIYTTFLNNQYAKFNGTSFSCPVMAGVCALILSKHRCTPSLTPCNNTIQLLEHLQKYSVNLGDPKTFGFGSVNIEEILKY